MLRALVALLLLANALTWAYGQGFLGFLGLGIPEQREPQRMKQQIHPEALHVLAPTAQPASSPAVEASPATVASSEAPAPAGTPAAVPANVASAAPATAAAGPAATPATPATGTATNAPAPAAAPAPAPAAPAPAPEPAVAASSKGPKACWEVGGYNATQTITLNAAMQAQTALAKRWSIDQAVLPARWIVYLGKFANADALQRRRNELHDAKVAYRDVNVAALQPGLALGTYSTEGAANQALQDATRNGVAGAKVVQERQETVIYILHLPAITDAERRQIDALPALAGKPLQHCS